ncbi:MAG TPA: glutamate-cysteine ligase family protein, partial [Pseudonocardiaceae bacterium]
MTADSPFHDGADTRYASSRREMWQRWPSAGPHRTSTGSTTTRPEWTLCWRPVPSRAGAWSTGTFVSPHISPPS